MRAASGTLAIGTEVEGLLQEIAADRNSRLLRVGTPTVFHDFFDRQPAVSAFSSYLTKAERHILQVHRTELALRLRELCFLKLKSAEEYSPWVDKTPWTDRHVQLPEPRAWRVRAQASITRMPVDAEFSRGQLLLERCLCDDDSLNIGVSQIALASMRVEANDSARVYVGFDMLFQRQRQTGLRMLRTVLSGKPSPLVASHAWQNIGLAYSLAEDYGPAVEFVKKALAASSDRGGLALNWMHYAILLGKETEVISAAERVDDLIDDRNPAVSLFIDQLADQRARGFWRPGAHTRQALEGIEASLGSASRRLLDVYP